MAEKSLLGQIAIDLGKLTEEQLDECVLEQAKTPSTPLGAVMVRKGYIDFQTLLLLLKLQEKRLDERARHSTIRKRDQLFGRIAVEYGFCTQEQLNEILRIQAQVEEEVFVHLGELMVQHGYLQKEDVRVILEIQDKKTMLCRECRTRYNVAGYRPNQNVTCTRCGAVLTVPGPEAAKETFRHGTTIRGTPAARTEREAAHRALPSRGEDPVPAGTAGDAGEANGTSGLPGRGAAAHESEAGAAELAPVVGAPTLSAARPPIAGDTTRTRRRLMELAPVEPEATAPDPAAPSPAPPSTAAPPVPSVVPAESATGDGSGQAREHVDRYELTGELGSGSHAVVYKAWDRQMRRTVAVKILTQETTAAEVLDFHRSIVATRQLDHPNLTRVYDYGEERKLLYIVSEFVDGPALRERLEEIRKEPARILALWTDMAAGMGHAHAQSVLHRDLKPDNMLIDPAGRLKITDFGIAALVGSATDEDAARGPVLMGTAPYMSPEQARGENDRLTPASDVYGLGAVAYEMYCGRPPHVAESLEALLDKVALETPAPLHRLRPDVPPAVEAVVMKCLARNPADRYPDAGTLLSDLQRLGRGEPPQAAAVAGRFPLTPRQIALTVAAAIASATALFFLLRWLLG